MLGVRWWDDQSIRDFAVQSANQKPETQADAEELCIYLAVSRPWVGGPASQSLGVSFCLNGAVPGKGDLLQLIEQDASRREPLLRDGQ